MPLPWYSPPPQREIEGALCKEHVDGKDYGLLQKPMDFDGSETTSKNGLL